RCQLSTRIVVVDPSAWPAILEYPTRRLGGGIADIMRACPINNSLPHRIAHKEPRTFFPSFLLVAFDAIQMRVPEVVRQTPSINHLIDRPQVGRRSVLITLVSLGCK